MMTDELPPVFENTQPKVCSAQEQRLGTGVGGRVVEARKSALGAGQVAWVLAPALAASGLLMKETWEYCCCRLVKSLLVVTLLPSEEMVTIP